MQFSFLSVVGSTFFPLVSIPIKGEFLSLLCTINLTNQTSPPQFKLIQSPEAIFKTIMVICLAYLVPLMTHLIQSPGVQALIQLPIFYDQLAVMLHSISYTSSLKLNSLLLPMTKKSCRKSASYVCAYGLPESTLAF